MPEAPERPKYAQIFMAMYCGAVIAGFGIAACSQTSVVAPRACPAPVPYSLADERELAQEMAKLKGTTIARFIDDYGVERAKLRACRG